MRERRRGVCVVSRRSRRKKIVNGSPKLDRTGVSADPIGGTNEAKEEVFVEK